MHVNAYFFVSVLLLYGLHFLHQPSKYRLRIAELAMGIILEKQDKLRLSQPISEQQDNNTSRACSQKEKSQQKGNAWFLAGCHTTYASLSYWHYGTSAASIEVSMYALSLLSIHPWLFGVFRQVRRQRWFRYVSFKSYLGYFQC